MSDPHCGRLVVGDSDIDLSVTAGHPVDKQIDNIVRKGPIRPRVDINGHSVRFLNGSIECALCDFEEDIPDLVRQSSGFRQVVYKLFLTATLTDYVCDHSEVDRSPQPNPDMVRQPDTYTINTTHVDNDDLAKLRRVITSDLNRQNAKRGRKI